MRVKPPWLHAYLQNLKEGSKNGDGEGKEKWHEPPGSLGESSDITWETGGLPILNKDTSPMRLLPQEKEMEYKYN